MFGGTVLKRICLNDFMRLRKLVYRNSRPIDYTKWKFLFENGSCEDYLSVLASYQNEDGGFGYNLECNNWNPSSSPYTVCIALDYLDVTEGYESTSKDEIIIGIIKYLASGAYMLEDGWVGMQGIPSNNDYSHMPWFHFSKAKAKEADIAVTKRLAEFILNNAKKDSEIYQKAETLREKYKTSEIRLVRGYPDYDPVALDIKSYDPQTFPSWLPMPIYYVGSPSSKYYPELKHVVDMNLDTIVDTLQRMNEIPITSQEELDAYEQSNPHPDGKRWCVPEQAIGNYYWGTHNITYDLDLLRKFGRLDFELPKSEHC